VRGPLQALFLRYGFDQVSVSQIAEAADVARPTVFAHFPHKEDMFFDRYPEVTGQLTRAIRERPAGMSAVGALCDTLVAVAQAGHAPYSLQADMIPWWRTVAASRPLQARARNLPTSFQPNWHRQWPPPAQPNPTLPRR
jgi:AcrR family transcriptional regulator